MSANPCSICLQAPIFALKVFVKANKMSRYHGRQADKASVPVPPPPPPAVRSTLLRVAADRCSWWRCCTQSIDFNDLDSIAAAACAAGDAAKHRSVATIARRLCERTFDESQMVANWPLAATLAIMIHALFGCMICCER